MTPRRCLAALLALLAAAVVASSLPPSAGADPSDLPVIIIPVQPPVDEDADDANYSIDILLAEPSSPWIRPGTALRWTIEDDDLANVTVGFDGSGSREFLPPYVIDTSSWLEGAHGVWIEARDRSNHSELKFYSFYVDVTPPTLDFSVPFDGDPMAEPSNIVTLLFSERLDNRSVAGNISLSLGPGAEGSGIGIDELVWLDGGLHLDIRLSDAPGPESFLMVSIAPGIRDLAGNVMGAWSNVTWRTWNDADRDGIADALDDDDDADGTLDGDDYRPLDPAVDSWVDVYWYVPTLMGAVAVAAVGGVGAFLFRE